MTSGAMKQGVPTKDSSLSFNPTVNLYKRLGCWSPLEWKNKKKRKKSMAITPHRERKSRTLTDEGSKPEGLLPALGELGRGSIAAVTPKSASMTLPSSPTSTFSPLISLWMNPRGQ
ncbi:MAG: hypothetical protein FRX49_00054 [Trebouxia sp. A1-2]|nr:MAG: hypothetical protein FRX49_00054 [Trebouxia sp. A1-2]